MPKLHIRHGEKEGTIVVASPTSWRNQRGELEVVRPMVLMRQLEDLFREVRMNPESSLGWYEYIVPDVEIPETIEWLQKGRDPAGTWRRVTRHAVDIFTAAPVRELSNDELEDAAAAMQDQLSRCWVELSLRKINEQISAAD